MADTVTGNFKGASFTGNTVNIAFAARSYRDYLTLTESANPIMAEHKSWDILQADDNRQYVQEADEDSVFVKFKTPDWGYADFINERAIWQKGLYSPAGEPGWFYFKIFFDFNTQYGLFGGLLNDGDPLMATNSAYRFLYTLHQDIYRGKDRAYALKKLTNILSFINCNAPWFFKSVKNVNTADAPYTEDITKERSIELEFNTDAIDMRLSTIFDLYKFVCYDNIYCREILPENLRKFDMSIVVFETPLKHFHTGFKSNLDGLDNTFRYKTLCSTIQGFDNLMSFKLYTFINCEIDKESLQNIYPNEFTSETPFQLGKNTIKIKYDRCYTHTMNEFYGLMWGDDGFYYDRSNSGETNGASDVGVIQKERYIAMKNAISKASQANIGDKPESFKYLVDASEAICNFNIMATGFNAMGNVYGDDIKDKQILKDDATRKEYYDAEDKSVKHYSYDELSDYLKGKLSYLYSGVQTNPNLDRNYDDNYRASGLGSLYTTANDTKGYNISRYSANFHRYNSDYLNDKLQTLHDGIYEKDTISSVYDSLHGWSSSMIGTDEVLEYVSVTDILNNATAGLNMETHQQIVTGENNLRVITPYFSAKLQLLKEGKLKTDNSMLSDLATVQSYQNSTTAKTLQEKLNKLYKGSGSSSDLTTKDKILEKLEQYISNKDTEKTGIQLYTDPDSEYYKAKLAKLNKLINDDSDNKGITEYTQPDSNYAKEKIRNLYEVGLDREESNTGEGIAETNNTNGNYYKEKLKDLYEVGLDRNDSNIGSGITETNDINGNYYKEKLKDLYEVGLDNKDSNSGDGITTITDTNGEYYKEKLQEFYEVGLDREESNTGSGITEMNNTNGKYYQEKLKDLYETGLDKQ